MVAARADLTGKLEQAWAVDNGTKSGSVSCTHDTRLTPSGKAFERPTLLVCWRTSSTLSAYAVVIDPKAKAPIADADGVAAVDTAWKAAAGPTDAVARSRISLIAAMRWGWGWGGVLVALGLLVAGAAQDATTDTVVTASAGTAHLGVGYRFPDDGWMGTYVVGNRPTFCIDLNGRGPSTAGGYVVAPATRLKKQVGWSPDHRGGTADALTGPALTAQELGRLAYLTDRYAAATSPETAAAAEHVVRLLTVGDAAQSRREKARWAQTLAAHPKVKHAFDEMAKDVAEHAGPYTLTATWVTKPSATTPGSLRITLLSAANAGMPAVALTGSVTGDARPITARTDRRGTATIAVTARARGQLDVAVTARGLAPAVPLLYTPENYADRGSPDHAAQRTVGAAPRASLSATASTTITGLTPKLVTTAAPRAPAVGDDLTDAVAVTGALPGWTGTVTARLWGPFPVKPEAGRLRGPRHPRR